MSENLRSDGDETTHRGVLVADATGSIALTLIDGPLIVTGVVERAGKVYTVDGYGSVEVLNDPVALDAFCETARATDPAITAIGIGDVSQATRNPWPTT